MTPIDPVCLVHGKKMSEHHCLYCCLCFKPLTPDECHVGEGGVKEDVCLKCAAMEAEMKRLRESGHGIKTEPPAFP